MVTARRCGDSVGERRQRRAVIGDAVLERRIPGLGAAVAAALCRGGAIEWLPRRPACAGADLGRTAGIAAPSSRAESPPRSAATTGDGALRRLGGGSEAARWRIVARLGRRIAASALSRERAQCRGGPVPARVSGIILIFIFFG